MNLSSHWNRIRLSLLLAWGTFVVMMTTQSDQVSFVHLVIGIFGNSGFTSTIGHAGLFAILTSALYIVLAQQLTSTHALWLAMLIILLLATGTELSQIGVSGRDASLADLLANWLGVFMIGFLITSFSQNLRLKQSLQ
jgi:hypothetical protein